MENTELPNSGKNPKKKRNSDFNRPNRKSGNDLDKAEANPFIKEWCFPVLMSEDRFIIKKGDELSKNNSKSIFFASSEDAKHINEGNFYPSFIDNSFVRLFFQNSGFKERLFKMKSTSHTLLIWILSTLDYGQDKILLNKQYLQNTTGLSKGTIYSAINELGSNNLIRKSKKDKDYYHINVQYFFQGNRGNYFPEFVKSNKGDLKSSQIAFLLKHKERIENKIKKGQLPPSSDDTEIQEN